MIVSIACRALPLDQRRAGEYSTRMKLKLGQRVVSKGGVHGTVLKRIKRNPIVCYLRLDSGKIELFPERELRPEPVIINLAAPHYAQRRKKRGKVGNSGVRTSRTPTYTGAVWFVSGGRVGSKG